MGQGKVAPPPDLSNADRNPRRKQNKAEKSVSKWGFESRAPPHIKRMRKSKETASHSSHEREQQGKKFEGSAIHHRANICKQEQAVSRVAAKQQDP